MKVLRESLAVWIALLIGSGGCYDADMSVADTNTSWLQSCERQSDCGGGYACVAGLCQAVDDGATVGSGAQASPAGASAVPGSSFAPPAATAEPVMSASGLVLGPELVLSEPGRHAGPPSVRWVDDHWVAAWQSDAGQGGAASVIEVAHVSPAGDVGSRRLHPQSGWVPDLVIAEDGRVGVLDTHSSCSLEVLEPEASALVARFAIPCGPDSHHAAVAPVPGSSDWIVAYGEGVQGGEYVVGRYRSELDGWVVAPTTIGPRTDYEVLAVFTVAGDALIATGGEGTFAITANGLAAPAAPANPPAQVGTQPLPAYVLLEDGAFELSQPGARPLLFGMDGDALWSVVLEGPGAPVPATRVVAATGVADRRPGVAMLAQGGLTAVCYATGPGPGGGFGDHQDGVSCVLVDADGAARGEPLVVEQAMDNIGGLDLAFSGERFLLVYWDIEMGPEPAPSDVLRGRILELH